MVIPHKDREQNKIRRWIRVGIGNIGYCSSLLFQYAVYGGSKQSVIKKAYKLLEYLRDKDGLLKEIISISTTKSPEPRMKIVENTMKLIQKYKLDL